jgi:hypothetical protein
MKDKNGYIIKHGQDVRFFRDEETIEVIGEVVDIFDNSILVQDEESDTYEVLSTELKVIMNRQCNDCGKEFNQADSETSMEEGTGKTLHEVKCCPRCRSIDIEYVSPQQ